MSLSTTMPVAIEPSPTTSEATLLNTTFYTQEELDAVLEKFADSGWIDFGQYLTIREAEVIHAASIGRAKLPCAEEFVRGFMEEAAEEIVKYREAFFRENKMTKIRGEREDSVDYELRMREEQDKADESDGDIAITEKDNSQNNEIVEVASLKPNKEGFGHGVQTNKALKEGENPSSVEPLSTNPGSFIHTTPDTEVFEPNTKIISTGGDSEEDVLPVKSGDHIHNALDEYHAFPQELDEEACPGSVPAVDSSSSRNEEEKRLQDLNGSEMGTAKEARLVETGSQTSVPAFEIRWQQADVSVAGSAESRRFLPSSQSSTTPIDPQSSVSGLSCPQYVQSDGQHPIERIKQPAYLSPYRQENQQPVPQVILGPLQPLNTSARLGTSNQPWGLGISQVGHNFQPPCAPLSEPKPEFAARYPRPPLNAPSPLTQPQMYSFVPMSPGAAFSAIPGSGGPALDLQHPPQQPYQTGVLSLTSPQPFQPPQPPRGAQKLSTKTEVALYKWETEYFEQVERNRGPATGEEAYLIRQMEREAFRAGVCQLIVARGEAEFMMSLLNMTGRSDLFGDHQATAETSIGIKRRLAGEEGNEYAGRAAKKNRQH